MIPQDVDQTHFAQIQSEPFSNAIVRADPEWHVRLIVALVIAVESLWIEFGRIRKVLRITMECKERNEYAHSFWNNVVGVGLQGVALAIGWRAFSLQERQRWIHS